jgi:hypothetical protein
MKEINIYINKHNNLCSIKSIENQYSDILYFQYLFQRILKVSNLVTVQVRRPYNKVDDVVNKVNNIAEKINYLKIEHKNIALSFSYNVITDNEDFIEVCSSIWFGYEQPAFCFFSESITNDDINYILDNQMLAWYDITKLFSCFMVFRGIEEDVAWIGKHRNLTYDMIIKM